MDLLEVRKKNNYHDPSGYKVMGCLRYELEDWLVQCWFGSEAKAEAAALAKKLDESEVVPCGVSWVNKEMMVHLSINGYDISIPRQFLMPTDKMEANTLLT